MRPRLILRGVLSGFFVRIELVCGVEFIFEWKRLPETGAG